MTTSVHPVDETGQQVAENIATTLHRAQAKQLQLATAVGMTQPTLSRRMTGQQPWLLWEVQAIADYLCVTLAEITTDLPTRSEWEARWADRYAIRDLNPEPADMSLARVLELLPARARIQAGEWPDDLPAPSEGAPEGRWLRAV